MPTNRKGPAGANRGAFYKLNTTSPIVAPLETGAKCYQRELAFAYREAVTSHDPRVMRLGLQVLWRGLTAFLPPEGA